MDPGLFMLCMLNITFYGYLYQTRERRVKSFFCVLEKLEISGRDFVFYHLLAYCLVFVLNVGGGVLVNTQFYLICILYFFFIIGGMATYTSTHELCLYCKFSYGFTALTLTYQLVFLLPSFPYRFAIMLCVIFAFIVCVKALQHDIDETKVYNEGKAADKKKVARGKSPKRKNSEDEEQDTKKERPEASSKGAFL